MKKADKKSSIYYGVRKNKNSKLFGASARIDGVRLYLGGFINEMDAAIAYDNFVRSNNLDRRLNFPDPEPENLIPNTRLIRLTQGKFAIVDEEDFEYLNQFNWSALQPDNVWYAYGFIPINGKNKTRKMHQVIMGCPNSDIDHINGDGLDNRKCNLRTCTVQQNGMNRQSTLGSSSKYIGVSWSKRAKKFKADIKVGNKSIYLGYFDIEEDAAKARDMGTIKYFGEFGRLNFQLKVS